MKFNVLIAFYKVMTFSSLFMKQSVMNFIRTCNTESLDEN